MFGRAVTKDGLHLNARIHVEERARLGNARLPRIQRHFDVLHFLSENIVVDDIRLAGSWARRRRLRRRLRMECTRKLGHGRNRGPIGQSWAVNICALIQLPGSDHFKDLMWR